MFYLGIHVTGWLAHSELADVPLFVSHQQLSKRKRLPRARGRWALDSGGFTELSKHGTWTITPESYVKAARRYRDEVGGLDWCAIQDWMCEAEILTKTGKTVREHQRLSVDSLLTLRDMAPEMPWMAVLQGWSVSDYLHHIDMYSASGIDLLAEPVVGVGSVCRRQATEQAEYLIGRLHSLGLKIHAFGFKILGLRKVHRLIKSSDSMAWSFAARKDEPLPGCLHKNCANCLKYALLWRSKMLQSLTRPSLFQSRLFD